MGYEFYVTAVTIEAMPGDKLRVAMELENRGVAPFYFRWPVELGLIADGKVVKSWRGTGKLSGLLPGDPARTWVDTLDVGHVPAAGCKLAVRVPNPLAKGNPVQFANKSQDADLPGWLTIGEAPKR